MSKTKHAPYTLRLYLCIYLSIYCIGLSLSLSLPIPEGVEDAVNGKDIDEVGESSFWVVSRIYCEGICDIDGDAEGDDFECCFEHLSILSLSLCFLFVVFSDG